MLNRTIFTAMLALGTGSVAAQEKDAEFNQLAEQCVEILNTATDGFQGRGLTRPLADELEALAQSANQEQALVKLLPVINEEAADCVAYARQIPAGVIFDPERNRYLSARAVRAQGEALRRIDNNKRAAIAEAEVAQQERLRQERQQALDNEVNARVFRACADLAMSDFTAAYTNALCVQSFKANGLPDQ